MAIPNWRCQDCGEDYDGCTCALANKTKGSEVDKQYPLIDRLALRKYVCAEYGNDIFVLADDLERVLEAGLRRYSYGAQSTWYGSLDECKSVIGDYVEGLTIGIREIVKKPKEERAIELLKECVEDKKFEGISMPTEWFFRAKALIQEDGVK